MLLFLCNEDEVSQELKSTFPPTSLSFPWHLHPSADGTGGSQWLRAGSKGLIESYQQLLQADTLIPGVVQERRGDTQSKV